METNIVVDLATVATAAQSTVEILNYGVRQYSCSPWFDMMVGGVNNMAYWHFFKRRKLLVTGLQLIFICLEWAELPLQRETGKDARSSDHMSPHHMRAMAMIHNFFFQFSHKVYCYWTIKLMKPFLSSRSERKKDALVCVKALEPFSSQSDRYEHYYTTTCQGWGAYRQLLCWVYMHVPLPEEVHQRHCFSGS